MFNRNFCVNFIKSSLYNFNTGVYFLKDSLKNITKLNPTVHFNPAPLNTTGLFHSLTAQDKALRLRILKGQGELGSRHRRTADRLHLDS